MCQPPQKKFPAAGCRRQGKRARKAVRPARELPGSCPGAAQKLLMSRPGSVRDLGKTPPAARPAAACPPGPICTCRQAPLPLPHTPRRRHPPRPLVLAPRVSLQQPDKARPKGVPQAPAQTCGRGETGSHSGLKIRRPQTAYGFESRRPHQAAFRFQLFLQGLDPRKCDMFCAMPQGGGMALAVERWLA